MYKISWYKPQRVVLLEISGELRVEEIHEISEVLRLDFYGKSTPLVHNITDLSQMDKYPSITDLQKKGIPEAHSQDVLGWTVIIGTGTILKLVASLFLQFANVRFKILSSQEEAYDFLANIDPTLNDPT